MLCLLVTRCKHHLKEGHSLRIQQAFFVARLLPRRNHQLVQSTAYHFIINLKAGTVAAIPIFRCKKRPRVNSQPQHSAGVSAKRSTTVTTDHTFLWTRISTTIQAPLRRCRQRTLDGHGQPSPAIQIGFLSTTKKANKDQFLPLRVSGHTPTAVMTTRGTAQTRQAFLLNLVAA